ncbi:hypothetical protein [Umezawaea beigongshangensis]|uniref:hypothetical protein n=1 Tax=Umezawaea beigongshangensis TaxID=2780383 RepID=UPI0018F23342|nr:hypothetical protein [Umezawaea beigongshangensis]
MSTHRTRLRLRHGDRVQHTRHDQTGTVHTTPGATPEVRWDGTCVADQLDLVRDHLTRTH